MGGSLGPQILKDQNIIFWGGYLVDFIGKKLSLIGL